MIAGTKIRAQSLNFFFFSEMTLTLRTVLTGSSLPPVGVHLTSPEETFLSEPILSPEFCFVSAVTALAAVVIFQAARTIPAKYAITNSLPA